MTLIEYIKLDDNAKNNLLIEKGELLDVYIEKKRSVHLFSIFNFFVEVVTNEEEKIILDIIPYDQNFRLGLRHKQQKDNKTSIINTLNYYFLI